MLAGMTPPLTPFPYSIDFGAAITPHNTTDFANGTCDAIYVGGAGDLVVVWQDGSTSTFAGAVAGTVYYFRARRVNATGTTATNLIACYT